MTVDVVTRAPVRHRPKARGAAARPGRPHPRAVGWQAVVLVVFVGLWQVFSLTPVARTVDMPGPLAVAGALAELAIDPGAWLSLGATVLNWIVALAVAAVIGIPVGLFLGRVRVAALSAGGLIDFLRTIPSFALVPILLLILGPTMSMVVFAAAFAGVWPLLIQATYAAEQLDPVLLQVSKAFRLRFSDRLRFVVIPELVAFVWPGLRLATTATLLVAVGAELIGGAPGIGSAMQQAVLFNLFDLTYAWVVIAAALGLAANGVASLVQRRALWWHASVRGGRA